MVRALLFGLVLLAWLSWTPAASADAFTIDLKVQADKASQIVHAEVMAPGVKAKERSILHVKAKSRITVQWALTNVEKSPVKNVVVHFFAVKEEKAGQQTPPKLDKGVVAESALSMDFGPQDKTRGELAFTIDNPGVYLLRLETIGAAVGLEGQEYFAALDLVVE